MSSDFSGEEGRGYADDDVNTPSSSLDAIAGHGAGASPLGNSSDLLADSDASEDVDIHVDSSGAWDGKPRVWPVVPGYDWAPHEVRQISSSFHHRCPFRELISNICLVKAAADARHFKLAICQMTELVCHDRGNYPTDFFYVYATMFKDLKVLLPFSDFQMGVLRTLNVAPTQLHPNDWAFMQAFSAIYYGLALSPTPAAFLYFFHVQPHPSKPWVSLRTIENRHLLVRQISSSFHHRCPFRELISNICLVKAAADARHFKLAICQMTELVCHDRGNYPTDFFYVYATMFKDLKVLLPFSDFQMGVLRTLNVAPTQLHPNDWAFMQAFSAIYYGLALSPTPAAFLYFFHVQPHPSKPWVSLRTIENRHLLTLFNSSYKGFKWHFFKVVPLETGYQSFCFPNKEDKFPFYWTKDPKKVISWPKPRMTPEDLDLINQLCQLPPKSSCRALIGFLGNKNLPSNVFDYLSKMDPSKSSTFARLCAQRGSDVRKPGGSSSRAPTTAVIPTASLPVQKAIPPPPMAEVPSPKSPRLRTDQAPQSESIPKKKGKRKAVRESSTESKHAKRSLPDGPPLSGLGMTEEEASIMAMELAARLTMCLAYVAQKRASASTELQALQEKFDATVKSNQDLTLRLAETERMAEEDKKKANTLLAEARATQRRMQRSLDDAKLDLQKATTSNTKLMVARLVQPPLQVSTDDPRLDVSMMVVDGKLVPIHVPPPSPPAVPNVEAAIEVIVETDGADVQP
ncbi:hypothetical protein LR48_Vigan02g100100 [Vigna angularis]|uniref:Uncharacterized protein n=1 Tax=Phaseolus angularis TaxID=3914 RepID=A0A0L9TWH4_PHAAN|nr:hypothetical protein LR48_Vigan02g100100 [Vigna angularis]